MMQRHALHHHRQSQGTIAPPNGAARQDGSLQSRRSPTPSAAPVATFTCNAGGAPPTPAVQGALAPCAAPCSVPGDRQTDQLRSLPKVTAVVHIHWPSLQDDHVLWHDKQRLAGSPRPPSPSLGSWGLAWLCLWTRVRSQLPSECEGAPVSWTVFYW